MNLKMLIYFAYMDPGSGSTIFQFLIAGLVGILWTIRCYFTRIKAFFTKKPLSDKKPDKPSNP